MNQIYNGIPARSLSVKWQKPTRSNPSGNCPEMAPLPDGKIAMQQSSDPEGPALIYTKDELLALFEGIRTGEFDHLVA